MTPPEASPGPQTPQTPITSITPANSLVDDAPAAALQDNAADDSEDSGNEPDLVDDGIDLSNDFLIPPPPLDLAVTAGPGELRFDWPQPSAGSQARLLQINTSDRTAAYVETELVGDLPPSTTAWVLPVKPHMFDWQYTQFILEICSNDDCLRSMTMPVAHLQDDAAAVVDASLLDSTDAEGNSQSMESDSYGASVSLAADGKILVAGDPDGRRADIHFSVAGIWWPATRLQPDVTQTANRFGIATAADEYGDHIVIGAPSTVTIDGIADGSASVYQRAGETWIPVNRLQPLSASPDFGSSVAISADASLIAVGAPQTQRVHLYRFDGLEWHLTTTLTPDNLPAGSGFGSAVALDDSGRYLLVSAPRQRIDSRAATLSGALYNYRIENDNPLLLQQIDASELISETDTSQLRLANDSALSHNGEWVAASLSTASSSMTGTSNDSVPFDKAFHQVALYQRDAAGHLVLHSSLSASGVHGNASSLRLALNRDGTRLAAVLLNPASLPTTLSLFARPAAATSEWQRTRLDDPVISHADTDLSLSRSGDLLAISGLGEPESAEMLRSQVVLLGR